MQRGENPQKPLNSKRLIITGVTLPLIYTQIALAQETATDTTTETTEATTEVGQDAPASGGGNGIFIGLGVVAVLCIVGAIIFASKGGKDKPKRTRAGATPPSPLKKTPPSPITAKKPLTPPPNIKAPGSAPPVSSAPPPAAPPPAAPPAAPPPAPAPAPEPAPAPVDTFDASALDSALSDLLDEPSEAPAPSPAPAPVAAPPPADNLFDSSNLDGALDDLFGDAPAPAPAPPPAPAPAPAAPAMPGMPAMPAAGGPTPAPNGQGGLFDSDGLDGALDDLFGDDPAPPVLAPGQEQSANAFDSEGLDDALDDLFGDAPAAAPAPAAPAPAPSGGGMFDSDGLDGALDDLFGDGGAAPAPAAPAPAPASNGMFDSDGLDGALDDLFGDGGAAPAPAPAGGDMDLSSLSFDDLTSSEEPAAPQTFSADSIGSDFMSSFKLDDSKSSINVNNSQASAAPKKDGLAPMGKMLVDQSTLEDIIKRAEKMGSKGLTTTQVILAAQGQSFDELLKEVNEVPGVLGTLIVGNDGLVIANTMPNDIDKEIVGALTSSIYLNMDMQIKKMQRGGMKRLVIETDLGFTVLSTIEMGTLVVFSQNSTDFSLNKLLAAVIAMSGRE